MRKFLCFFFFFIFFSAFSYASVFVACNTMQEVEAVVESKTKDLDPLLCLAVFDIDETLLMSTEPAIHGKYRHQYRMRDYVKSLPKDVFRIMLNLSLIQAPSKLVDHNAPFFIQRLQQKGIKTIACTASMTGSMDTVQRMEVFRYERLKQNNIDFSVSFPDVQDITLNAVKGYQNRSPVFYKGVLCANGTTAHEPQKGEAILAFLKATNHKPAIIILIDDKDYYLEDVEKALKEHMPHIIFVGIQFKGALHEPVEPISEEDFWAYWKDLEKKAREILKKSP